MCVSILISVANSATTQNRNMAVLASVQDRVESWNKGVKMPQVDEDSGETIKAVYTSM